MCKEQLKTLVIVLLAYHCYCLEFYYMPTRGKLQCFEEYMSGETLVTGEIYSAQPNSIYLWVLNPKDTTILEKVLFSKLRNLKATA